MSLVRKCLRSKPFDRGKVPVESETLPSPPAHPSVTPPGVYKPAAWTSARPFTFVPATIAALKRFLLPRFNNRYCFYNFDEKVN